MKTLEKLIKECEYKLKSGKANYQNTVECDWLLKNLKDVKKEVEPKWISVKDMTLEHLKEGDSVLTLDTEGNLIPYKFFLGGLNMIGEHSDNNRKITHWLHLPCGGAK
jgi:hypothetical protein